jgi:hypothetical protein
MLEKSIVRLNAEKDPSYCPYCCRCSGLVRMVKIESFYWECHCGAKHDERSVFDRWRQINETWGLTFRMKVKCLFGLHTLLEPGPRTPLLHGSAATINCACGAWRMVRGTPDEWRTDEIDQDWSDPDV